MWKESGITHTQIEAEGLYDENGEKKGTTVDDAISYGGFIGAIDGVMTYFGSKLFNPGMLNGLGNRVVANITSSVGGQALLNTLGER